MYKPLAQFKLSNSVQHCKNIDAISQDCSIYVCTTNKQIRKKNQTNKTKTKNPEHCVKYAAKYA